MDEKEKTIVNYMNNLNITREEAEQLYIDDLNDFIGEEGEELTTKAKQTQHREKSDKPRNNKPKERKIDKEKQALFNQVHEFLTTCTNINNITTKTETEITFNCGGNIYTWKFTKHRAKK